MRGLLAVLSVSTLVMAGCDNAVATSVAPRTVASGPSLAVGGAPGGSASGSTYRDYGSITEKFTFNAHYAGNGSVVGHWELRDVFTDGSSTVRARGDVTCLTVEADGQTARMGGTVTYASVPLQSDGAIWTVKDNGEGANAAPDQTTDLRAGAQQSSVAYHCATGFLPSDFGTWGDNLRANVQVTP